MRALEEANERLSRQKAEAAQALAAKAVELEQAKQAAAEAKATASLSGLGVDPEIAAIIAPHLVGAKDQDAEAKRIAAKLVKVVQVQKQPVPGNTVASEPTDPRAALEASLKKLWR